MANTYLVECYIEYKTGETNHKGEEKITKKYIQGLVDLPTGNNPWDTLVDKVYTDALNKISNAKEITTQEIVSIKKYTAPEKLA